MIKYTLQNRLTAILIGFSIVFISVFTLIALNNQLDSITSFNIYRSKLGAFITKNSFETAFSKISISDPDSVTKAFETAVPKLLESGVIENATLISKDGKISSPSEQNMLSAPERSYLDAVISGKEDDKWLFSYTDKKKREINIFIRFLQGDPYVAKLTYRLGNIQDAFNEVYIPIIIIFVIIIMANIILAMMLSGVIISPIKSLNRVTKEVASGNYDLRVKINTNDELQELGDTFNHMTVMIKKMKERAENANPLTKLPGNLVIMEEIERRIKDNEKFGVIYSDLNEFKAFNDQYGIYRGDEVIKMTADVLKDAISRGGSADDMLGHEGGDDFIIVTTPGRIENIAKGIVENFDRKIKQYYSKEDSERGFFAALNREGKLCEFPIMGISLACVTNQYRRLDSYAEVTNICAEVKKKAKSIGKSVWLIDQRASNTKKGEVPFVS